MKFTINSKTFANYVNVAFNLLNTGSVNIAETFIKIIAANDGIKSGLKLHAATKTHYVILTVPEAEILEPNIVVINGEHIAAYIKQIAGNMPLTVELVNNDLYVLHGKKKFKTSIVPLENFITQDKTASFSDILVLRKDELNMVCTFANKIKEADCRSPALSALSLQVRDNDIFSYFGDGSSMYKMNLQGTTTKENITINIPLSQISDIKKYLALVDLGKEDAVTVGTSENMIRIKHDYAEFYISRSAYEYPNAHMLFNNKGLTPIDLDVDALAENFEAAEAAFSIHKNVICSVIGKSNIFEISNEVKDLKFQSEIDNPNYEDLEFHCYTANIAAGASFMKNDKAKLHVLKDNMLVKSLLFQGAKRAYMTGVIIKEKVNV